MSNSEEAGQGMLEASPGAIALVMLFFLVVTLGFERLVHAVKHFLTKRKRFGLVAAVNSMSNEIMLLGLAALILVAIETPLTNKCARVETRMRPWLSHVHDCACCLTRTRGVTDCFLQERQCPSDFSERCNAYFEKSTRIADVAASDNALLYDTTPAATATAVPAHGHRRLAADAAPQVQPLAGSGPYPVSRP
eukprot:jgi/Chrzof1/6809/Cz19g10160.t1